MRTSRWSIPRNSGPSTGTRSRRAAASARTSDGGSEAKSYARSCAGKPSTSTAKWWAGRAGGDSCSPRIAYQRLLICPMGIDRALLERRLDELYAIAAEPGGGTYRPLYGDAWATALDRVERWLTDAGLETHRDAVGNLWGRATGTNKGKSIVTGSHIDTVRHGGRLDGALGICAGLTAVETLLSSNGKPRRALEVVAICEEEGSRFSTNFWGSRAITGAIDTVDPEIAAAMRERGLDPTKIASAARDDIETFVELHIEQGAVLESAGTPLAVVSAIVGTAHLEVTVTGRPDHAGTTPMDLRLDALAGAAAMIQAVESIAKSLGQPAVATIGKRQ